MHRRSFIAGTLGVAALWHGRSAAAQAIAATTPLPDLPARTLAGGETVLRQADIRDLAARMRGVALVPDQSGYDAARRLWNGMHDRHPALIARCAAPSDVMAAVDFAREHQLLTAVHSGGHSMAGKSMCDGGIVVDLSPMQGVRVDPVKRTARVEGGALLGHLDRETRAFGLVTTAGTVSHTGAAGLTLGGGFGRVARRFGLACDNVLSIDVVTADGRLLVANEAENADLYWALRGGGGNFGAATSFEYRLHPMDPTVLSGIIAWPFARAREVMTYYAEFTAKAPDELNLDLFTFPGPDGQMLIGCEAVWSVDHAAGERVLAPLRAFGPPVLDTVAPVSYVAVQAGADEKSARGKRYYAKSGFFTELTPAAIETAIGALESVPPGATGMFIQQSGGAISRAAIDSTAFPNRKSRYWFMSMAGWTDPSEDELHMDATRAVWKHVEPLTDGFYINEMIDEQYSQVASNYGTNYARLAELKRRYDPANLFRLNANITPA